MTAVAGLKRMSGAPAQPGGRESTSATGPEGVTLTSRGAEVAIAATASSGGGKAGGVHAGRGSGASGEAGSGRDP